MRKMILLLVCMIFMCGCQQSSTQEKHLSEEEKEIEISQEKTWTQGEKKMENIHLVIHDETFVIELENNATVKAFVEKLPITLSMSDLNHNEKYCYLDENLPAQEQSIGNIQIGDVMLFGDNCLVVFYENFSTSYQYTRIGRITDVSKLKEILGSNEVDMTFMITK